MTRGANMNVNFFDIVNDRFFLPLSSRDAKTNYLLLKMINDQMKNEMDFFERGVIIDWIKEFFNDHPTFALVSDEDGISVNEEKKNHQEIASRKLSYFEKCGWFNVENTNDFKTVYQMEVSGIKIIEAMVSVVSEDYATYEFTGHVHNIYLLLKNFDIKNATTYVEQMHEASTNLNNRLRSLNASIKRYLKALIKDNAEPKELLDRLLIDYQENVIAKAFNNLRTTDNPARYRSEIISQINIIRDNYMEDMVDNYIKIKCSGKRSEQNVKDAETFFFDTLYGIEEQFNSIHDNIELLDQKNVKYVSATTERVKFLISNEGNIEGRIYDILKNIEENQVSDKDEFTFNIFDKGHIDEHSLFTAKTRKRQAVSKIEDEKQDFLSEEELELRKIALLRQCQFSIKKVNEYIIKKLGNKNKIDASEIQINNYDELIVLFLAQAYSLSELSDYDIKIKENTFKFNNSTLTDYTIIRRVK